MNLLAIEISFFRKPDPCNPKESHLFIFTMFLELADCLRQTYAQENKNSTVGWFCTFLLDLADSIVTELKPSFLVLKYLAYYVEHLKCSDKLSEALEHAKYLRKFLADNFGEDYFYWLEDVPNADELCEELECVMAER